MDFGQMESLFSGQGIVFWAAVVAVALGLTLLLVSIAFQLRKVFGRRTPRITWPRLRRRVASTRAGIAVNSDTYQVDGPVPLVVGPNVDKRQADMVLAQVLSRLRGAADSLDRIHTSLDDVGSISPSGPPESTLKSASHDVDYIFRANHA